MERVILHCDLNNFYASVECVLEPSLKHVPLVVGGSAEKRHGIVLAKNEIAKKAGIKTGEVLWQAQQKIKDLVVVPPNFDLYQKYSKQVFDIYTRYTNLVEPFGPDECWLDVSGSLKLFGSGKEIADILREVVTKETGLTISAGVSFTKIFAKIASDLKKPNATTVVSKESFRSLIWNLPVSEMFMIGKKSTDKLVHKNIKTIGDLANADDAILKNLLGINGIKSKLNALGLNDEPIREYVVSHKNKSIGHGMTSTRDITTYDDAEASIYYLADMVAARMRKHAVRGSGVSIDLRDKNLESFTRQQKLNTPIRNATDIGKIAAQLCRKHWNQSPPLRTITVSVYDLCDENALIQGSIFDSTNDNKNDNLDLALDKIRTKYGGNIIKRANLIERDFIYDKNENEDFLPFKR